jgi:site-specific recombinase XerD
MEEIKQFNQTIEVKHYSKETHKSYQFHIEKFRRYYGDNLTKENILRHLHYLTNEGFSPSTINITRAALLYYANNVLNKEIKPEEIVTIKRPKPLPKPIEVDIIKKIIDNTPNLKHRIVLEVLYGSGLRLGEVVKIEWNDINFVEGILRVNKGKGNKDRLVKLGENVIKHLLDYKDSRYNKTNIYVFDSMARPNTHISKKTVQKILENSCKKAKIKQHFNVHRLRHSYATHSLEAGVDIRKIQEALGHSSPKTTMIYTKVTKDTIRGMISPLDLIYSEKLKRNSGCVDSKVTRNGECDC